MLWGRVLAGAWVQYQVFEGVSCSECFLLIHRVCVGGCVSAPQKWGGGGAGTYLIHWLVGHQVHQVKLVTVMTEVIFILKQKVRKDECHPDSSLERSAPLPISCTGSRLPYLVLASNDLKSSQVQ